MVCVLQNYIEQKNIPKMNKKIYENKKEDTKDKKIRNKKYQNKKISK